MNQVQGVVEAQLQRLMGVVEAFRHSRCGEVLIQGRERAKQILASAHRDARARMHRAVMEDREHMRQQIHSAEARMKTRDRQRRQQADQALLHQLWGQLQAAMQQRWQDAAQRQQWIDTILDEARAALARCTWEVIAPQGWDPDEQKRLLTRIEEYTGSPPTLSSEQELVAGLRICADGACVDGTLMGLLSDRRRIEAELLAEINRHRPSSEP